jgi:hypothetical protein
MSKLKVSGNASGTGVITLEAPNTNTDRAITLPDAAGTLLMTDGDGSNLTGLEGTAVVSTGETGATKFLREDGDGTCSWQAAGGDNTPSFFAYRGSSTQSFSDNVLTKIQFNTEVYDTDSAYDISTNHRFTVPSGEGGKYYIHSQLQVTAGSGNIYVANFKLYKNGSFVREEMTNNGGNTHETMAHQFTSIEDLSAGDYVEMYYTGNTNPGVSTTGAVRDTYFMMFKLLL